MRTRTWESIVQGHPIKVVRRTVWATLDYHHSVYIDDLLIAEKTGKIWDQFTTLFLSYEINGIERKIEIRFGKLFVKTGVQILIDNQWCGGDQWINYPEQADIHYQNGLVMFLLKFGVLNYGLPYGIGMTIVQNLISQSGTPAALLFQFASYTLLFGTAMGLFEWRSIRSIAESRKGFLNGSFH